MKEETAISEEAWVVEHPFFFRYLTGHAPPRPYSWLFQLQCDARAWKVVALWAGGLGCIALGIVVGQWTNAANQGLLIVLGLWVLIFWFRLFRPAARTLRDGILKTGIIDELGPHPLMRAYSVAQARTAQGETLPIALPTVQTAEILATHGRAEVLFLSPDPDCYGSVLGIRPATANS